MSLNWRRGPKETYKFTFNIVLMVWHIRGAIVQETREVVYEIKGNPETQKVYMFNCMRQDCQASGIKRYHTLM